MEKIPRWLEDSSNKMPIDLLAFSPHPDDAELNIGGILALHSSFKRVAIIDLTEGEMSSNGTVEVRKRESRKAAGILNVHIRKNLYLPDSMINSGDLKQQERIVATIRYFRPRIVLVPYWKDRHPDHQAASKLIDICLFKSGLKKFKCMGNLEPYRPEDCYYYLQHEDRIPDIVVDVSSVYKQKLDAIKAYESQFYDKNGFATFINQPMFLKKIVLRDEYFGSMIGVRYGEGLIKKKPLSMVNLFKEAI